MANGDEKTKSRFVLTDNVRAALIVGLTVIAASILLGVATFRADRLADSLSLPFLVMAGLIALLGVLASMAIAFKTVRLANQTQALGLPEGTIRAVIALSLILIFAVVTVYLFSALSNPTNISVELEQKLEKKIEKCCPTNTDTTGSTSTTSTTGSTDTSATTNSTTNTTGTSTTGTGSTGTGSTTTNGAAATTGSVTAEQAKAIADKAAADKAASDHQASSVNAAQDFAKQLLIMLGTLITSITSFYFGSKTATDTSAGKPTGSAPKLTSLDEASLKVADLPKDVIVSGTGLQLADTVTLRNAGGQQLGMNNPLSSETTVQFSVPASTPAGKWDVVVKTRDGGEATLPGALTIT